MTGTISLQVCLMPGKVQRQVTRSQRGSTQPVFEENFSFHLPYNELQTMSVLMKVCVCVCVCVCACVCACLCIVYVRAFVCIV